MCGPNVFPIKSFIRDLVFSKGQRFAGARKQEYKKKEIGEIVSKYPEDQSRVSVDKT
jgi:hypothetical protein